METPSPTFQAGGGLSRRLLWLTFGVVLFVQVLFFVPAVLRARLDWLHERIAYGQLAVLSLDDAVVAVPGPGEPASLPRGETTAHRDLLRLAGVESVRLMQPGSPPLYLGTEGQTQAARVIDLRRESDLAGLREVAVDLFDGRNRLVLVQAPAPVRPGTLVSVVFSSGALTSFLRGYALDVAGLGLVVAGATGLFLHFALQAMLVRPMRRLTQSIAAFRRDPERTPPLETEGLTPLKGDEVALAGSELAEMQRELRAALWQHARLAALGTAVAKVSHDLRSMLAPALLSAERLQSNADPNVRRIGDTVVRAVERATELVRGGLEFAREGPVTLERTRFLLRDAVADCADQVRASLPALQVENLIDATLEIDADREHVGRVLANLMRNAGEASAGQVSFDAVVRPTGIEIFVTDNGPGLPPRIQAALFKPFVTGGRRGSTGLGLAIARDLMRAHLGDIDLVWTREGGTRFRLCLPVTLSLKQAVRVQSAAAD